MGLPGRPVEEPATSLLSPSAWIPKPQLKGSLESSLSSPSLSSLGMMHLNSTSKTIKARELKGFPVRITYVHLSGSPASICPGCCDAVLCLCGLEVRLGRGCFPRAVAVTSPRVSPASEPPGALNSVLSCHQLGSASVPACVSLS